MARRPILLRVGLLDGSAQIFDGGKQNAARFDVVLRVQARLGLDVAVDDAVVSTHLFDAEARRGIALRAGAARRAARCAARRGRALFAADAREQRLRFVEPPFADP